MIDVHQNRTVTKSISLLIFNPADEPEARLSAAHIIGYLFGYAHLTNTRSLTLLGDAEPSAYELLFSFFSPAEKDQFHHLVRSNEDMGNEQIENDVMSPTIEEISDALPLATVLPQDVLSHATSIAAALCAAPEDDRAAS